MIRIHSGTHSIVEVLHRDTTPIRKKKMALNVELLESSFAQIEVNSVEAIKQFYTVLFTDYPEVQPLFAHTQMEKQHKQLFQSLVFTVNNLRNPDVLSNALRGLGTRHVQYGVLPQHYPMVGSSLLKAFEVSLGAAWTPDVQQAWTEAYEVVAQLMLEGTDYLPESLMPVVK
jgi:hemoglobin-like flavoprotein